MNKIISTMMYLLLIAIAYLFYAVYLDYWKLLIIDLTL